MTSESGKVITLNMRYLYKLRELNLNGNNENKIDNEIGDDGCYGIFRNAKYFSDLEILYLNGNRK